MEENKLIPSTDYNYWLKGLDTNKNSIKVLKPYKTINTLGIGVIYSPMSPPSLINPKEPQ